VRRVGDPLHVRSHAAAYIQKQQNIQRHVLAGEITDRLGFTLFAEHEILDRQARNGAIVTVDNLRVHPDQRDITAKNDRIVSGQRQPGCAQDGQ